MKTPKDLLNLSRFHLERFTLGGPMRRVLLVALAIGLLALAGGLAVRAVDPTLSDPAKALWWSFLRITDPGYLGDDQGVAKRFISTVVTVMGLVMFVGMMVAIMTQWLNATLRTLERGLTPVTLTGHIVILGWTNRTVGIIEELARGSERTRSFLRRRHARRLRVVVLVEEVVPEHVLELKHHLGELWDRDLVILRSGTPLKIEHLERVNFLRAAAVVLPGPDEQRTASVADTYTIKTILSLAQAARQALDAEQLAREDVPLIVAEIFDSRKIQLARSAYPGQVEILASDLVTASLITQEVRHRGLSVVYGELLSQEGNEFYARSFPQLAGAPFHTLHHSFPRAIPVGVIRARGRSHLALINPPATYCLGEDDALVFVAEELEHTELGHDHIADDEAPPMHGLAQEVKGRHRRILIMGWNHKVPSLIQEFDTATEDTHELHILSRVPVAQRERHIEAHELRASRVSVHHHEGDYTLLADLKRVKPETFEDIVFLSVDWMESDEESDARTIIGMVMVRDHLQSVRPALPRMPELLIELQDEDNAALIPHRDVEILINPVVESHMLAQITVRSESRAIFDAVVGPHGPDIVFRDAGAYEVVDVEHTFAALQREGISRGEIVLGVRLGDDVTIERDHVVLNPGPESLWTLRAHDDLIVFLPSDARAIEHYQSTPPAVT